MTDMLSAPSTPPVMPAKARDNTSTWKFGANAQARLDRLNSMNTVSCSVLRSKRSAYVAASRPESPAHQA